MLKKAMLAIILAVLLLTSFFFCRNCNNDITTAPVDNQQQQEDKSTEIEREIIPEEDVVKITDVDNEEGIDFLKHAEGLRPYAVMIDNEGIKSLPQGGLNLAQILYEIVVEGGETRIMPVFWGVEPEMIGPVRSSRHYFLDYAMEHDAIYIHFGWSPMAERDISKFKINNANGVGYGGGIFWDITNDINNWQDSYTSTEKIRDFISKAKYRTETDKKVVFTYNKLDKGIVSGENAEKITLRYSHSYICSYEYDAFAKAYKRFRKGKPHMERVSGEQLEAKNIIIQNVNNYTIEGDTAGRQEVDTVGSGDGWYITCGKAVKIKWSKESRTAQTKYLDENGNEIVLNPGQTWVQIFPLYGEVIIE